MDLADIKEILRIVGEQGIAEFELEQDGVKLRVCKGVAAISQPASPAPPASGGTPASAADASAPAPVSAEDSSVGLHVLKSPIVGTFYRAPDPNATPFASVGDRVRVGQVLCIVEAMKLMNEIESDVAGEIVKIHPENGQAIQYGDPIVTIRPA